MKSRFAAIVLAAGLSSRMEAFKPLLPVGDQTVTDRVTGLFRQNGVDVILVVGHRRCELLEGIDDRGITVVENRYYRQGMFTSVQAGVSRLPDGYRSFFVMPVDIPLVRPASVARLLDEAVQNPGRIVYPAFLGTRGHPPLIPANIAPAITGWRGDGGLKSVLRAREDLALELPVPDGNILLDIDTDDNYREILGRLKDYDIPADEECAAIFDICNTPQAVRRHGAKVAKVAGAIARDLNETDYKVNMPLVRAAAILHDIAKGQPQHDAAGGRALCKMGFGKVGDIVAVHTDLAAGKTEVSLEAKIVYLADKLVAGERLVSVEERYGASSRRFSVTPEVETIIRQRRQRALSVKQQLEKLLGRPVDDLIS